MHRGNNHPFIGNVVYSIEPVDFDLQTSSTVVHGERREVEVVERRGEREEGGTAARGGEGYVSFLTLDNIFKKSEVSKETSYIFKKAVSSSADCRRP